MAQIDVADAAMAGVKLTFRKPLTVLIWGVLITGYIALIFVLFGAGLLASIAALARNGVSEPGPQLVLGMIGSFFGFVGLLFIGLIVIGTVVATAAIRAELAPDKSAFAYMRLGGGELWVLGANVVLTLIFIVTGIVLGIPLAIVSMALGFQAFAGGGFPPGPGGFVQAMSGMIGVRLLGQVIIQVVIIWLWCRLAPGVVMTFRERQFRLFESWNLTRGHALPIFLTMLLVTVVVIAMDVVAYVIVGAVVFGTVLSTPGISDPGKFFARPPSDWIGIFGPTGIVAALLFAVVAGVATALKWAAVARIYTRLQPDTDVAETFA
ncbi:MAG: hypothetical protein ACYC8V_04405 [Caulobacteraceae bacterium]